MAPNLRNLYIFRKKCRLYPQVQTANYQGIYSPAEKLSGRSSARGCFFRVLTPA